MILGKSEERRTVGRFSTAWLGDVVSPPPPAARKPAVPPPPPPPPRPVANETFVTVVDGGEPQVVSVGAPAPMTVAAGYGALMSVDYAACEQTKARSLVSLPVGVVDKSKGGKVPGHCIARLLSGMANDDMTGVDLLAWTRLRCDTFGNAYLRVEWWRDQVVAIWPVLGTAIHRFDRDKPAGYRARYDLGGDKYNPQGRYFAHEVVNVKTHVTKDGVRGVSLAKLAAEEIGLSVDLERFYSSMLHNGNHHFGHVEIPERKIPDAAMDDLRAAVDAKAGLANAGKAPIFAYGAKWVNDGQTMRDASLIEQQQWVLRQVCRACNVPPWKVYDQEGATYAGSQQANIDYVTETMVPDVRIIEKAFTPVFQAMNQPDLSLKLDVRGLMRGDDASRSQYYREMTYSGNYTRADVRELEDMPPIPGLEKPLFPLNYGTVEEDGSVTVYSSGSPEPADGNQTGVTD